MLQPNFLNLTKISLYFDSLLLPRDLEISSLNYTEAYYTYPTKSFITLSNSVFEIRFQISESVNTLFILASENQETF